MFKDLSLSLSLVSLKWGMSYPKTNGMPKKHDPKKIGTHEGPGVGKKKFGHMNVQEKNNNIAMSSCYSNKRERDP